MDGKSHEDLQKNRAKNIAGKSNSAARFGSIQAEIRTHKNTQWNNTPTIAAA
jgi:hypothetical protein